MDETWREIALKKSQQGLPARQKERKNKNSINENLTSKGKFNFIDQHVYVCMKSNWTKLPDRTPTNMSATVKLMTKYMLRVRRLLFFIKIMMARRFTAAIATNSTVNTVNQMIHSDDETTMLSYFRRWCDCFLILCYL